MIDLANEPLLARYRRALRNAVERPRWRPASPSEWDTRPFHVEQDRRDEALEWPVRP
jgi:hypothetical protein